MTNSPASTPEQEPAFIEVGNDADRRRIAVRARTGPRPGCSGSAASIRTCGHQGDRAGCVGRRAGTVPASGSIIPAMGESGGAFVDGTIGRWLEETVAVFEQFCAGPQVVIGSSMGGWMALLLAREMTRARQAGHRWPGWC